MELWEFQSVARLFRQSIGHGFLGHDLSAWRQLKKGRATGGDLIP